jgi:hypothetical protein
MDFQKMVNNLLKKNDLPQIDGWKLENLTYKKGGKAAFFNEEKQTLSIGIYIPAGAKIAEEKINNKDDIKKILNKYS